MERTTERPERSDRRSERDKKQATPNPTRQELFEWIEDKFKQSEFPRYLQMKVGYGPGGQAYREQTVHQEEFKPNSKAPERAEMVAIANKFISIAQTYANEVGKPTLFILLAVNHTKGAAPYGMFPLRMRPELPAGAMSDGPPNQEQLETEYEVSPDSVHRDRLFRHMFDHSVQNDEHLRWMHDNLQKSIGGVLSVQQQIIGEQREHIRFLEGQRLEAFKAVEQSLSQKEEREMKRADHQFRLDMMNHGFQFLKQMVPVVVKTLDRNKEHPPALPANGTNGNGANGHHSPQSITDSPESIAIKEFVNGMTDDQKAKLFGQRDPTTNAHLPGIFTVDQTRLIGSVAELISPPDALDLLMDAGSPLKVTDEQIALAQEHVPMDKFAPLYFLLLERQKQKTDAAADSNGAGSNDSKGTP